MPNQHNLRIIFSDQDGGAVEGQIEVLMEFGHGMVERGIWQDFWLSGSVCLADCDEQFGSVESTLFCFEVAQ